MSGAILDDQEQALLTIINNFRRQNNIPPLSLSIPLTNAAKWLARDMASKNYLSHTDSLGRNTFDRLTSFGYTDSTKGENISAGSSDAQGAFTQWQTACDPNGSGRCTYAHRMNMLSPNYTVIGIGRSYNPNSTYKWYWATTFGGRALSGNFSSTSMPTHQQTTNGFGFIEPNNLSDSVIRQNLQGNMGLFETPDLSGFLGLTGPSPSEPMMAPLSGTPSNGTLLGPSNGTPLTPLGSSNGTPLGPSNGTPLTPSNGTPLTPMNGTPLGPTNGTPLTPLGPSNGTPLGPTNGTPLGTPSTTILPGGYSGLTGCLCPCPCPGQRNFQVTRSSQIVWLILFILFIILFLVGLFLFLRFYR
jgi:hypothetical protein